MINKLNRINLQKMRDIVNHFSNSLSSRPWDQVLQIHSSLSQNSFYFVEWCVHTQSIGLHGVRWCFEINNDNNNNEKNEMLLSRVGVLSSRNANLRSAHWKVKVLSQFLSKLDFIMIFFPFVQHFKRDIEQITVTCIILEVVNWVYSIRSVGLYAIVFVSNIVIQSERATSPSGISDGRKFTF